MLRRSILLSSVGMLTLSGFIGCSSTTSPPAIAPKLSVPDTVRYQMIRAGLFRDSAIVFVNTGTDTLRISSQTFSSPVFLLADTTQSKLNIAPGGSSMVRIRFAPTDSGAVTATDAIVSNAGTTTMVLTGGAIARTRMLMLPTSIDFGDNRIGICNNAALGATRDTVLTIQNTGNDSLRILSASAPSSVFSVVSFDSIFAPGASGSLHLRFCPEATGLVASAISIVSNATQNPSVSVMVQGNGIPYLPGLGSVFNFIAVNDSIGAGGKIVISSNPAYPFDTVVASNSTYAGQSGITQIGSGANPFYYKVLPSGDVLYYGMGVPVAKDASFGSGWWTLPVVTQSTVSLFTGDTTISGSIALHVSTTASNSGDTTITINGRAYLGWKIDIIETATYGQATSQNYVDEARVIFVPEFGFAAFYSRIIYSTVLNANSGAVESLTGFTLK